MRRTPVAASEFYCESLQSLCHITVAVITVAVYVVVYVVVFSVEPVHFILVADLRQKLRENREATNFPFPPRQLDKRQGSPPPL